MKNFRCFTTMLATLSLATAGAHAATYYWDSNSSTLGFGNTAGTWGSSNFWNDDSTGGAGTFVTPTTSADTVNFGTATANYANGSIGVAAGGVSVGDIVIGAGQTQAITLGTAGNAITIYNGITKNAGSAAVTITSPITLGGVQSWTNNSASTLTINAATNLNGNALTITGSGFTKINGVGTNIISGAGGITVNGARFELGGGGVSPAHTYSGDTTLTGGATLLFNGNFSANSNINLNGGVIESYWTGGLNRTIGTGGNQIRITGGESGFAMNGSNGATFTLGALTWGDANFNPTKLLLQNANSQGTSALTLASAINLNGANRTIVAHQGITGSASSTISGNITNSAGTAGLIKEGQGILTLTGASNTYNGGTTISAGTLAFGSIAAMPNTGVVAVNNATLGVEVGGGGDWTGGTSGVGTLGGLLAGLGGAGSSTVTYTGNVGLRLNLTGNTTFSGDIANVGTTLALTKLGNSSLTLSGNNTYSGGTTLAAGPLAIGSANALGTGTLALNGGTIQSDSATARTVTNAVTIGGDFTVGGTGNLTFSNTGASALAATRTITVANGITAEFAQAFSGAGGITKGNTIGGILKLSGTSTYTGKTTINDNAGGYNVLEVTVLANGGVASSIGQSSNAASNLLLKNGTALRYVGSTDAVTDRAFSIDSGTAGHGVNIESSGTGTLTFSGGPALSYGGGGLGRYITFGGTNTGNNTFGKVITNQGSGAVTINKAGTGTWILTQANTYTGGTNINDGTLLVNNTTGSGTGTGSVIVGANGTLGGTGTIGGPTTISGIHSPGNSPGIQTFLGNLTYNASSAVNWELVGNTVVNAANPNALFDTVVVGGSLDFAGPTALNLSFAAAGSVVDWSDAFWTNSYTGTSGWLLYDVTGTTSNLGNLTVTVADWLDSNGDSFDSSVLAGSSFSLYQDGNDVYLNYTYIPEPAGLALLGLGGMLMLPTRRRR